MINAFSKKAALLTVTDDRDEYGRQRFRIDSRLEVMAMPTNVTRSEFYEASRSGYKVSRVIRINSFLYRGERYVLIDGKIYKVIKTYEISHLLELTLEDTKLREEGGWLI